MIEKASLEIIEETYESIFEIIDKVLPIECHQDRFKVEEY
jgi:hypothetical protein